MLINKNEQDGLEKDEWSLSEDVNDIISTVPSWILRRGITVIFCVLLSIVLLSAFIRYPDVIKTPLKVNSLNSPKAVISNQAGRLIKLLAKENEHVSENQNLAYIESTAKHEDVLLLFEKLKAIKTGLDINKNLNKELHLGNNWILGELQNNYEIFYQEYLQFNASESDGFFNLQKKYLERDLAEIKTLQENIVQQMKIQEKEYENNEQEYLAYKRLKDKNVISNNEYKQHENKYLSSKYPLMQSSAALSINKTNYLAKQKELATLDNSIVQQRAKFTQALNSMIHATQAWIKNYIVTSPLKGTVSYSGILQENQNVAQNQDLFVVNPGNTDFFGEVYIPQYNMGKIALGQRVIIKLRSYPFEEYGAIEGKVSYITDVAYKDSLFIAKININKFRDNTANNKIILKNGMVGDAEIITKENSLLQRLLNNITKLLDNG